MMTPPCEAIPAMAALKKSDEAKFKAICTGVRTDGAYVEAGENDNLIVQKLEANPGTIGIFGYSYPRRECRQAEGHPINGVVPTYQTIALQISRRSAALHLRQERARRRHPGVRAFVAEFTKESAFGPNGYLLRAGMVAAPNAVRARSQLAARSLSPLNLASLK